MSDFQRLHKDALSAFMEFQGYSHETMAACCENAHFETIRIAFHLAETHYKEVNRICNDLCLWHAGKVEGRKLSEWSQREHEENILVRSLLKMTSASMSTLQAVYLPWLTKSQFTKPEEARPT